jgi:aryl-alcohol dehydrogenase-like predicted oxidoreductase
MEIPKSSYIDWFLRAQTWHNPSDVEEALDQSLKTLQLDYGEHKQFF